jgi:predicted molibdopterin-dependent oxidoreductase YjgC
MMRLHQEILRDMLPALWQHRRQLAYLWQALNHGVCEGCSLGSRGLRDDTLNRFHLCPRRLRSLPPNCTKPLTIPRILETGRLSGLGAEKLRALGRLPHPLLRRRNDAGFCRISWSHAFDLARTALRNAAPHELAFCANASGMTNESYYVFQKLARVFGANSIDVSSPDADMSGSAALRTTLGFGASTCSFADLFGADMILIAGADVLHDAPMLTEYLRHARIGGSRVILIDPAAHHDPTGLAAGENQSCGFIAAGDQWRPRSGGESAFFNGVVKALLQRNGVAREFVAQHTAGFDLLAAALSQQTWNMLEDRSGTSRDEMAALASRYGAARRVVFLYGSGLAQGDFGTGNVKSLVNLALCRNMIGRHSCGIMQIHAESGTQGALDCGVSPEQFPGGMPVEDESARRLSNLWHHPVSSTPGLTAREITEAAQHGTIRFLYALGAGVLEPGSDEDFTARAWARVPVRIHQGSFLDPSMLLPGGDIVLILPAQTCYEQEGGTVTSSDRKIRFVPPLAAPTIGESLPAWRVPALVGRSSMPNGDLLFPYSSARGVRGEMSRIMPIYTGIEQLCREGDYLQWGGAQLYANGRFRRLESERALFSVVEPPARPSSIVTALRPRGMSQAAPHAVRGIHTVSR